MSHSTVPFCCFEVGWELRNGGKEKSMIRVGRKSKSDEEGRLLTAQPGQLLASFMKRGRTDWGLCN